ncbi:MAG: hypothetical protein JXR07_00035 [Reichenbachiella sp.]
MKNLVTLTILALIILSCQPKTSRQLDTILLASMGNKYKTDYETAIQNFKQEIKADSTNLNAWVGLGETEIILFLFGYTSRSETVPIAEQCLIQAHNIDSLDAGTLKLSGLVKFLDWNWEAARQDFLASIATNPSDLSTRHWYSLWLVTMGRIDEALVQHDTITSLDTNEDFLVGRGSIYYFLRDNKALEKLMLKTIAKDPASPWPYDWLGMAYIEQKDYKNSLDTYFKAFELSDGTVEVGAGLGHALGFAGEYELAKQMADYYEEAAKTAYLPQMQRAFIHIGIGEHEKAIDLLEEAYDQKSWFLIFMGVEPWLDPLREMDRFKKLKAKMNYPDWNSKSSID